MDEKDAKELSDKIEEMLDDGKYKFAEDTLVGIQDTILRSGKCTEKQRQAVANIENSRGS